MGWNKNIYPGIYTYIHKSVADYLLEMDYIFCCELAEYMSRRSVTSWPNVLQIVGFAREFAEPCVFASLCFACGSTCAGTLIYTSTIKYQVPASRASRVSQLPYEV